MPLIQYALDGDSSPDNLRLLCGKHNRLEAERKLGVSVMRRVPGEKDDTK